MSSRMRPWRMIHAYASAFLLGLCLISGWARGQSTVASTAGPSGLTPPMQEAIKLYEEGQDTEAMDRFIYLLMHGELSERPLANEYLNLITQRMNFGGEFQGKPLSRLSAPEPAVAPGISNEERIRQDIDQRMKTRMRYNLEIVKDMEGLQLTMADSSRPKAIGVPVALLFGKGVLFRKDSFRFLNALTSLVYSLGSSQVVLLPEGFTVNDSRIIDMRRTLAISSFLMSAGIAPPRLRANLLEPQIDMPKSISEFRGIIILFNYSQPLPLKPDHILAEQSGPPISLGSYPQEFRPDMGQGALIEFSVVEPPAGILSWRFRILPPGFRDANLALSPIQEVMGYGPVFHQIYWNGRKGYWGKALATGAYEMELTATDAKNRKKTLRRWIYLGENASAIARKKTKLSRAFSRKLKKTTKALKRGSVQTLQMEDKTSTPPADGNSDKTGEPRPAVPPDSDKPAAPEKKETEGDGNSSNGSQKTDSSEEKPTPPESAANPSGDAQKPVPPQSKSPLEGQDSGGGPGGADQNKPVSYKVSFGQSSDNLTPDGEQRLAQAADAIGVYPQANLKIIGYAGKDETNPESLSADRAKAVSAILVKKYSVDPKRIRLQSRVADSSQSAAEIYIVSEKE